MTNATDKKIEEAISSLNKKFSGIADIVRNEDEDKYQLFENFVRHFMVESSRLILDAQSIAMFRDMPPTEQISCFVQGLMIAIAGTIKVNVDHGKYPDKTETVRQFMNLNVEVGIQNCQIIDDALKEAMIRQ